MSEHEWKFGDWLENDAKERCRIIDIRVKENVEVRVIFKYGSISPWCNACCFTHLSNCDSWDWQPPLQLREGAWYERRDGEIVGPCVKNPDVAFQLTHPWKICQNFYSNEGKRWCHPHDLTDLICEVPAPTPPAPKYRPFKDASEFEPHRERWVRWKSEQHVMAIGSYNDKVVWPACASTGQSWGDAFDGWQFENGEPFGVREQ